MRLLNWDFDWLDRAPCNPRRKTRPPRLIRATAADFHCFFNISNLHPLRVLQLVYVVKMSSPTSRRSNRNSVNGTPRRSTRGSEAPMSYPPLQDADATNDQVQSEAGQASQQNTPTGNVRSSQNTSQSQAPPTSSPLFFRSSPQVESQSQSRSLNVPAATGVNGSSPLRQRSDAATPRPSGGIGGTRVGRLQHFGDLLNRPRRIVANPLCDQL